MFAPDFEFWIDITAQFANHDYSTIFLTLQTYSWQIKKNIGKKSGGLINQFFASG